MNYNCTKQQQTLAIRRSDNRNEGEREESGNERE
jgi:hypothetical protein